jgi:hypothetical protein
MILCPPLFFCDISPVSSINGSFSVKSRKKFLHIFKYGVCVKKMANNKAQKIGTLHFKCDAQGHPKPFIP